MRFLVFGLLLSLSLSAQYEQGFQYVYPVRSNFEDVVPRENGCVAMGYANFANVNRPLILALDSTGTPLWQDSVISGVFGFGLCVEQDMSGNLYVGGDIHDNTGTDNIFCKKYDATGNDIWYNEYNATTGSFTADNFYDMYVDGSENVAVVGRSPIITSTPDPTLLVYNGAGNLTKDTAIDANSSGFFLGIKPGSNGVYALSRHQIGSSTTAHLHRYTSNYQHQWSKQVPVHITEGEWQMAVNPSNYIALCGKSTTVSGPLFAVCRPNGDTVFTRMIVSPPNLIYDTSTYVVMDSTKNVYVVTEYTNTLTTLSRYDTSGTFYWTDTIPRSISSKVDNSEVIQAADGKIFYGSAAGVMASLVVYDSTGTQFFNDTLAIPGLSQLRISRVNYADSMVYISGLGTYGTNDDRGFITVFRDTTKPVSPPPPPNSLMEETISQVSIYPSPANDFISIQHDAALREVWVYDVLGKEVLRIDNPENRVSVSLLAKGQYFVKGVDERGEVVKGSFLKK